MLLTRLLHRALHALCRFWPRLNKTSRLSVLLALFTRKWTSIFHFLQALFAYHSTPQDAANPFSSVPRRLPTVGGLCSGYSDFKPTTTIAYSMLPRHLYRASTSTQDTLIDDNLTSGPTPLRTDESVIQVVSDHTSTERNGGGYDIDDDSASSDNGLEQYEDSSDSLYVPPADGQRPAPPAAEDPVTSSHESTQEATPPPEKTVHKTPQRHVPEDPLAIDDSDGPNIPFKNSKFHPTHPECPRSYNTIQKLSKTSTSIWLKPLSMSFEPVWDNDGWVSHTHPNGSLYFYSETLRTVTNSYLYDKMIRRVVEFCVEEIKRTLKQIDHEIFGKYHLVLLDVMLDEHRGLESCRYYLVDHQRQSVGWLHDYHGHNFEIWSSIGGVSSRTHIQHEIMAQYWYHCYLFPSTVKIQQDSIRILHDIILFQLLDTKSHPYSTSPFSREELSSISGWVNSFDKTMNHNESKGSVLMAGATVVFSQLMFRIERERFLHFHGQPHARLSRDISIYDSKDKPPSIWIWILSPLMVLAPIHYHKMMAKMQVDGVVHIPAWRATGDKLTQHWKEFIIYAIAIFSIGIAFLSIQSIDSIAPPMRHPAQIACYMSIIFSSASVIVSAMLVKTASFEYLNRKPGKVIAIDMLAILYSLPIAFLFWGSMGFAIAFCCICFINTTGFTSGPVASALALTGVLVGWAAWASFKVTQDKPLPLVSAEDGDVFPGRARSRSPLNEFIDETICRLWRYLFKNRTANPANGDEEKGNGLG